MDILVSSNLERLLFELSGKDGDAVAEYMSALSAEGRYEVPATIRDEIHRVFAGGFCPEADTMNTIKNVFNEYGYLIDTHTAVAYKVLKDYRTVSGDTTAAVVVSTASPFKFCDSVLDALGVPCAGDGAVLIDKLAQISGAEVPASLAALKHQLPRFTGFVPVGDMKAAVTGFLGGV
jgi:threonine synthase